MTANRRKLLALASAIVREDDGEATLASLAACSGWSTFHLQRRFRKFVGESPKQFTQRVRLDRAAAELLASEASILQIALDSGFASHEVFSRAFRRRFDCAPREYRKRVRLAPGLASRHRAVIRTASPCLGLYRVSLARTNEENDTMTTPAIERRMLESEQPILFIRRRLAPAELQQTMGECFGALYGHGQMAGLAIAGLPIARYVSSGVGLWTVDFIMPLALPAEADGEMQSGTLPSGPVAFAVHQGAYDSLPATNAAIVRWIEENGFEVGGPPWEHYVTDPGETPDPADWRTEVFWPLKAA